MRMSWLVCGLLGAWLGTVIAGESTQAPAFVLMGDSTVTDGAGWGQGFKAQLAEGVVCVNTAAGGRSSRSFIDEGRLAKALALKGRWYLIQFGHNDQPGKGPERETDPATTYRTFLARYVDEVRAMGATPILVTSLVRRDFGTDGRIRSSLTPYAEAATAVAAEKRVPLVDLHARSRALCDQLGPERSHGFNPPSKDTARPDITHLNAQGSPVFARLVVEELIRVLPATAASFRPLPATP
jgi:pectinesterase